MDREYMMGGAGMMMDRGGGYGRERGSERDQFQMMVKSMIDAKESSKVTMIPPSALDPTLFKPVAPSVPVKQSGGGGGSKVGADAAGAK